MTQCKSDITYVCGQANAQADKDCRWVQQRFSEDKAGAVLVTNFGCGKYETPPTNKVDLTPSQKQRLDALIKERKK